MIVDINIKQLGSLSTELRSLLNECDEAELNIFNQLKDACINWQDGNSVVFDEKIKDEKKQTQDFFAALEKNHDLFISIYNEYKSIGNKLYANLEKKEAVLKAIDNCIDNANAVIADFDGAERSFYYPEITSINSQRDAIIKVRDNLKTFRKKIEDLYKDVSKAEERIKTKIAKLEDPKIGLFVYGFK